MSSIKTKNVLLPWGLVTILTIMILFLIIRDINAKARDVTYLPPMNIVLTKDGKLIIKDSNGKRVKPIPNKEYYPNTKIKALVKVQTLTIMEFIGSHYYDLEFHGETYHIPLPPPHPPLP